MQACPEDPALRSLVLPPLEAKPAWRDFVDAQRREQRRIVHELVEVGAVMPLLMKQRNGERWTAEEQRKLHARLRRLARLSPYLLLLLLPGSVVLLPLYAWWLDRRRARRRKQSVASE